MSEKKESKGKKTQKTIFDVLHGKEVVMQLLKGIRIEGTFAGLGNYFFCLTDATIYGTQNICKTPICFVHMNQVQHFHMKGEVIPIEEESKKGKKK